MKSPLQQKTLQEEGTYVATLYRMIYLGTVEGDYRGTPTSNFQLDLTWELNDEMKVWKEGEEAKPVAISKTYTLSLGSKSNLRPIVEGMIGGLSDVEAVNYDLDELLGKTCLLNITHGVSETGKEKLNLTTSKLMKSMVVPKPFNKQIILDYQKNWDEVYFQSLPEWLRNKMKGTVEYQMKTGTYKPLIGEDVIDDGSIDDTSIPF